MANFAQAEGAKPCTLYRTVQGRQATENREKDAQLLRNTQFMAVLGGYFANYPEEAIFFGIFICPQKRANNPCVSFCFFMSKARNKTAGV